jgi:hypothetical protein
MISHFESTKVIVAGEWQKRKPNFEVKTVTFMGGGFAC